MSNSSNKILLITGDFGEDYEYIAPYTMLKALGFEVEVGCPSKLAGDTVASCVHDMNDKYQTVTEWEGHRINLTVTLDEINAEDYIALIVPGGRSCEYLRTYSKVRHIATHFIESNKPIAAICRGPQILLATGLMKGRRMTGNFVVQTEVELAGAEYVKLGHEGVVVDGNLVTAVEWHGMWMWLREFMKVLGIQVTL
ncbi:Putative cysteine protease YraA [Poriferisphaera corsica]|uniref:Cysteine protease YraA n=1 Tax=Poriferisphaera corsica TaxID=2528020 RepID=A0A517YV21_9BACT|nr:DJ-1/PfpI family protein [Poriferisphaera corsica]QDU34103.1 Putative cysteine protease YraA [Poriferisphaera corsica]